MSQSQVDSFRVDHSARDGEPASALAALPRERLVDRALEAIKDYIIANRLQSNDRLPSEQELAQSLGVSRNVVRQALSSLEAIGIVRTEHGRGTFVAEFGSASRIFQHLAFWLDIERLDQASYVETRRIFDSGVYQVVLERATDEDLDHLDAIVREMESASTQEELLAQHDAFHLALFEITGNRFLSSLGIIMQRFFWDLAASAPHVGQVSRSRLAIGHRALVDGFRRRDPSLIPALILAHLTDVPADESGTPFA